MMSTRELSGEPGQAPVVHADRIYSLADQISHKLKLRPS